MRSRNNASGFSLLEVIVVLAIIGGALVMYTNYARKQAAKEMRQSVANALVQEMKGVVNYLRDDTLPTKGGETDNPFYDTSSGSNDAHYRDRITNAINDVNTGNAANYFLWGDGGNAQKQQRYLFISKNCHVSLKSEFELTSEYLPCSLVTAANNPAAKIERIGFASEDLTTPSSTVSRMDAIIAFAYTDGRDKYSFASYASAFNNALNSAGLIASHIMVVRRKTAADAWQLVTKADGTTPVEFSDMASNLERLEKTSVGQQLGIRLTFDMNDNNSGGGNAGNTCWNSAESKVELCYDQESGTGAHGEDKILALNMTNPEDPRGDRVAGTLKANLVMENTSRPVFVFKRKDGGELMLSADGNPERFTYTDDNNEEVEGDLYLDDDTSYRAWGEYSWSADVVSDYYPSSAYDAFELVTPAVTEYSGAENLSVDITGDTNYTPVYDDKSQSSGSRRFAVQTCPAVEQEIVLRDANGDAILDDEGNKKTVKITRALYPRLSASISSVSAYSSGHGLVDMYTTQNKTRRNLSDQNALDLLGGVTVQVELAEQDNMQGSGRPPEHNAAQKYIFPGTKYIWAVTSTVGMYDSETGKGVSIANPLSISYVITKWCSTIPQSGTPYDLLGSTKYK